MAYSKSWSGDDGKTNSGTGERIPKASQRIQAYGTIDELNSFIGLSIVQTDDHEIKNILIQIQKDLFILGANLCHGSKHKNISDDDCTGLENIIKDLDKDLPDLKHFILPGGTKAAAMFHICRTVCRRAERQVLALADDEDVPKAVTQYLNRLSDVFFQLARVENARHHKEEFIWKED